MGLVNGSKKHIHGSWRLHSAWGKAELPARAPPLTLVLVYALAHYCRSKGWTDTLVLLLLGFHTYARTGELFSAKVGDFDIHPTTGMGVWKLPLSKSGQRQGSVESLTINDQWVGLLVHGFCRNKPPGDFLRVASPPSSAFVSMRPWLPLVLIGVFAGTQCEGGGPPMIIV